MMPIVHFIEDRHSDSAENRVNAGHPRGKILESRRFGTGLADPPSGDFPLPVQVFT